MRKVSLFAVGMALSALGCGPSDDAEMDDGGDSGGVGAGGGVDTGGNGDTGGNRIDTGGSGNGTGGGSVGAGGSSTGEPQLPSPTAPCPTIVDGNNTFFGRTVRIWAAPKMNSKFGPLIFLWHGTGSNPEQVAAWSLGASFIEEAKSAGGVIAAMSSEGGSGTTTGNNVWFYEDFDVADEILACAVDQFNIDTTRIHATGMSAGALQTAAMSYSRSNYLASVATYSGGIIPGFTNTEAQDPSNKVSAMILHGGESDFVAISFQEASENYRDDLRAKGHFAFICNHGAGHNVPDGIHPSTWQFFQDHPYGTIPSPYGDSLPSSFPDYCTLD